MRQRNGFSEFLIGLRSDRLPLRYFMATAVAMLLLLPTASAQTAWSVEGSLPMYGEYNGANPLCLQVLPPYATYLAPVPPAGCPAMTPFNPGDCSVGGSAFDDNGNLFSGGPAFPAMLHTDGRVVEMTDAATGSFILTMFVGGTVVPGTISGLGYNRICRYK